MRRTANTPCHRGALLAISLVLAMLSVPTALAADLEVLHADSLAGPMRALKAAFEAKNTGVNVKLTSGVSRVESAKGGLGRVEGLFIPSSGGPSLPGPGAGGNHPGKSSSRGSEERR